MSSDWTLDVFILLAYIIKRRPNAYKEEIIALSTSDKLVDQNSEKEIPAHKRATN